MMNLKTLSRWFLIHYLKTLAEIMMRKNQRKIFRGGGGTGRGFSRGPQVLTTALKNVGNQEAKMNVEPCIRRTIRRTGTPSYSHIYTIHYTLYRCGDASKHAKGCLSTFRTFSRHFIDVFLFAFFVFLQSSFHLFAQDVLFFSNWQS